MAEPEGNKIKVGLPWLYGLLFACIAGGATYAAQTAHLKDLEQEVSERDSRITSQVSELTSLRAEVASLSAEVDSKDKLLNEANQRKDASKLAQESDPVLTKQVERLTSSVNTCEAKLSDSAAQLTVLGKNNNSVLASQIAELQKTAAADQAYMISVQDANKGYGPGWFEDSDVRYKIKKDEYDRAVKDISALRTQMRCAQ